MSGPLNSKQFFHGTHAELNEGDYIEPGHSAQHSMSTGNPYHDPSKVYVSPYQHVAAQYAWKKDSPDADWQPGHMYEVAPEGRLLHDPEVKANPRSPQGISYTAKRAKVIRKVDPREYGG